MEIQFYLTNNNSAVHKDNNEINPYNNLFCFFFNKSYKS